MKKIYLIKTEKDSKYKIGIAKNCLKRLDELQTGSHDKLILINYFETKFSTKIEKALHNYYSNKKLIGEWFDFSLEDEQNFVKFCQKIEENIKFLEKNKI